MCEKIIIFAYDMFLFGITIMPFYSIALPASAILNIKTEMHVRILVFGIALHNLVCHTQFFLNFNFVIMKI